MGQVSKSIPLYNGMSQQAPTIRLDSQGEEQINGVSSLVYGLGKRPGSTFVQYQTEVNVKNAYFHQIQRDDTEEYIVAISGDPLTPIEVYDLNGGKRTVRYGTLDEDLNFTSDPSVRAYFTTLLPNKKPSQLFRAVSVADYTLIVNRSVTPAMDSTEPEEVRPKDVAFIWVKQVVTSIHYYVNIWNGSMWKKVEYQVGIDPSSTELRSVSVANSLVYQINSAGIPNVQADFAADNDSVGSSVIKVFTTDGSPLPPIEVSDDYGDQALIYFGTSVKNYNELPPTVPAGTRVEVIQNAKQEFSNYYTEFDSERKWKESRGWSQKNRFDARTMPHRLVRMPDNTFVVAPCIWEERKVGDDDSNLIPSFVGESITSVFFYKDRLGFLSKDNIIFSRTGDFFNFWSSTALDVWDDDPIDIGTATSEVGTLLEALPFNKGLLIRGNIHQYMLTHGEQGLSPKTVTVDVVTRYETLTDSNMQAAGSNVYFSCGNGQHVLLREFFVQADSYVEEAADITAQVPQMIPAGVIKIQTAPQHGFIFVLSSSTPNNLYVYQYYWQGNKKPQSAWHIWQFPEKIYDIQVFDEELFLITSPKLLHMVLERIKLDVEEFSGTTGDLLLDSKRSLIGIYHKDGSDGYTTWKLPYTPSDGNLPFKVYDGKTLQEIPSKYSSDKTSLEAPGNWSNRICIVGRPYTFSYTCTPWYLKDSQERAILDKQLQMKRATLDLYKTSFVNVEITQKLRAPYNVVFNGVRTGDYLLDAEETETVPFRVTVHGKGHETKIRLWSDDAKPCYIQGITFEGRYNGKSKWM